MEIIALIASLSGLLIAGANYAIFIIIKFNDMKHIADDIKEIKEDLKCFRDKFIRLDERVSTIEGRLK